MDFFKISSKQFSPWCICVLLVTILLTKDAGAEPTTDTVHLSPTDDAMVRDGSSFQSRNYGRSSILMVKQMEAFSSRRELNRRAFIKFDTSAIHGTVLSAKLQLYIGAVQSQSTVRICGVDDSSSWNEGSLTWSNQPSFDNCFGEQDLSGKDKGDVVEWDVAAFLRQHMDDGNSSEVSLVLDGTPAINRYSIFYSKEHGNASQRPKLLVQYLTTHPPTAAPITKFPTIAPITPSPTMAPVTPSPTRAPVTPSPTIAPVTPSPTIAPVTPSPTRAPITPSPTTAPVTPSPTKAPVTPSPTKAPATRSPTKSPVTPSPTKAPTDPTTTSIFLPSTMVPYDLEKFKSVLDTSRLQYPESSPTAVNAGRFGGYSSDGFKLVNDEYIQFQIDPNIGARSELRHNAQWSSSSSTERSIFARVAIPKPDVASVGQFTFLQIHAKDFLGHSIGPLLRVVWFPSRSGKVDWLWANIRTSLDPKANAYIPLLPRPDGFFEINVVVASSKLSIFADGQIPNEAFDEYDISYWDSIQTNYFKAGAYINTVQVSVPVTAVYDELIFVA